MLPRFNTVFSARILVLAAGLFAIGAATLAYNITKAQPPPKEWLPAVPLQASTTTSPAPTPNDTPSPLKIIHTRTIKPQPRLITPPEVTITHPQAGTAFDAPAEIVYEAHTVSNNHRISKVEFFLAPTSGSGSSVCNYNRDIQIPQPSLIKRTEVRSAPYLFRDNVVNEGTYAVYAVVHTTQGIRQISNPVPISVNRSFAQSLDEISGWRLDGGWSGVEWALPPNFKPRYYSVVADSEVQCLEVKVKGAAPTTTNEGADIFFEATAENAQVPEDLTYQWKLSDGRIVSGQGSNKLVVNTTGLGGTIVVAEVRVERRGTSCSGMGSAQLAITQPHSANEFHFSNFKERLLNYSVQLKNEPTAAGLIVTDKATSGCAAKGYLIHLGVESHRIRIFLWNALTNATQLWIVPVGASLPEEVDSSGYEFLDCTRAQLSDRSGISDVMITGPPRYPYTECPDLAERIHFMTGTSKPPDELNVCLHNDRDPQNDKQQIPIGTTRVGIFGSELKYKYVTDGGVITGEGDQVLWDLSPVKTRPGFYSVTVEAGDDCACKSLTAGRVLLTNFCTPCFSVTCTSMEPDVANNQILLHASVPEWVTKEPLRFEWTTSQGTIVQGQGTSDAVIDTRGIPHGTLVTAKVKIVGLPTYCVKEVSYVATVGVSCVHPRKFDEYGSIASAGSARAAKRNQGSVTVSTEEQPSQPAPSPSPSALKEREYIKILWPNPVETQRSFSVVVKYDRTTQSLQLTDTSGNVTEALTTDLEKLIKDKWGDRYEVWAAMRLQSAALGCPQWCKDDFKPLAPKQQQWSFNLTSSQAGNFSFNLELWVEGRAIDQVRGKDAEPVWRKDNLPIAVREVVPTKNQIYTVGALLCFAGVGFFFRGVKFGNIRIMFAGGDIVGRDKVGGDRIGGDKIGGDKIEHWENPDEQDDG